MTAKRFLIIEFGDPIGVRNLESDHVLLSSELPTNGSSYIFDNNDKGKTLTH